MTPPAHAFCRTRHAAARCGLFVMVALLALTGVAHATEQDRPPILSAAETDYPPFSIVDDQGRAGGFAVELMHSALAAMGRNVIFRTGPWPQVRHWLETGQVQALPLVGRTPEREPLFDFTFPYMSLHGAIVVRAGNSKIANLGDLAGKRVAMMQGDNAEEFLRRQDRGIDIVTMASFEEALRALSSGHCEAVVVQRLVALRLIQETGLKDLRILNQPIDGFRQDFCFAVKEGDRQMLALLNEGLALVMADGTYRRLHAKWFAALELPANRRIVVGGDHNYPPYEYLDENGRPAGYNVELTRAIAREIGLDIEIRLGPWSQVVQNLENGGIDVIQGMFYSPERDLKFDFTAPHEANHYVGVVRKDKGHPPETLKELAGRRIVVQDGDIVLEHLAAHGLIDQVTLAPTQEDVLRQVAAGNGDCGLAVRVSALHLIQRHGWADLKLGRTPIFSVDYCYAVKNGHKALLASFGEGLKVLKETGQYRRIHDKWLGVHVDSPSGLHRLLRYGAMVAVPLMGVLLAVLLWSWSLRKQVAKQTRKLRESETKYSLTFNASPDAVNINRLADGLYVDINDGFTRLTGFTREDVIGKTSIDINIWCDPQDRKILIEGLREKGFYENLEARFRKKDGRVTTALMSARVITLNEVPHIISITRDISERKQAEMALVESENKWRNILVNTPQIGISLDPQAKIVFANDHFLKLTGWSQEEIMGRDWFDLFIPAAIREQVRTVFHTVMGQKDTLGFSTYENEIITRTGEPRNVAWSNVLTKDTDGHIVDVTCLGIDLTERVRAEADKERLRLAIEQAGEIVAITDAAGSIQYVNPAFEAITGYHRAEVIGKNPRFLKSGHHDVAHYKNLWETILAGNRWAGRMVNKRKDGALFTSECSITPVKREDGAIENFVWISRDITKEMELEKRIAQSQRIEAIGALAGGIAHDFNNILFPIIGLSEMLLEDLPAHSLERENVAQIFQAARRAGDLVKQILAFSRQADHQKLPVRIQTVLKEVVNLARSTIPADIGIELEIQQDCGLVLADPTQLHQIAMNLITNALHAVEQCGGRIAIALEQVELADGDPVATSLGPGTYARLSVADTGQGIDPAVMGRIFEPYFTTKDQGKGTGLGLSVVFGIVRDYGGDIRVTSQVGKGSTFTIDLPTLKQADQAVPPAKMAGYQSGTERVLLVDDEAGIVRMQQIALERLGYKVSVRTSSVDALEAFKAAPNAYDLVITDMAMPNLTGDQLARELIAIRPGIRIILCTGFSERVDAQRANALGIKAFVMKPVVISELAAQIRQVLDS